MLAMMISIIPVASLPANAEPITPSTSLDGEGTEERPFLIKSAGDLAYMRDLVNASVVISTSGAAIAANEAIYELTADIVLSDWQDGDTAYTGPSWTPIGTSSDPFYGTFIGNGHTISGIYINDPSDYQGLFGYVESGTIANLKVANSYISGGRYAGGIVGYNNYGTIDGCYNSGSVSSTGEDDEAYAGGIVGYNYEGSVEGCYNTGDVSANGEGTGSKIYAGGIVGYDKNGTIDSCYNTGDVSASGEGADAEIDIRTLSAANTADTQPTQSGMDHPRCRNL